MATDLAVAGGMGRGEYSAKFGNIRALTVIIAPLFYGNIYAYYAPRGKPGYAWFAGAMVVALAEALHRTLKDEDCFPKGSTADLRPSFTFALSERSTIITSPSLSGGFTSLLSFAAGLNG